MNYLLNLSMSFKDTNKLCKILLKVKRDEGLVFIPEYYVKLKLRYQSPQLNYDWSL